MNKAFVREPDPTTEYCPRCGSKGEPVGRITLNVQKYYLQCRKGGVLE
jgi:transposase